ncbi:MAG: hypothetical protein R3Y39_08565 [Rikenellaceae bacterium]
MNIGQFLKQIFDLLVNVQEIAISNNKYAQAIEQRVAKLETELNIDIEQKEDTPEV